MMVSDIQRMTGMKADILTAIDNHGSARSGRAIAATIDADDSVIFHTMWVMDRDGWIQPTQEFDDDLEYELTERGLDLVDLVEFGSDLSEDTNTTGDTAE